MSIHSERHPPGPVTPAGFHHAISRWVVEHTGLVTLLTVWMVAASCFGQWWLAFRHAQDWEAEHPGSPIPFRLFAAAGWLLLIGTGTWLALWHLSSREHQTPSPSIHADRWQFERRKRQRIFEGRPVSRWLLWAHGLFGLLGFALGVALALRLSTAAAWQEPLLARDFLLPSVLAVLVIMMMVLSGGRVRDVLFVLNCDNFPGESAQLLAQAVAEEEQAEREHELELERERKTITGWPYVVFMGGFVGGLYLANRWLPPADGSTTGQAIVSGLIGSVAALYLLQTKPHGWQIWLGVAFAVAVGFLVFTHVMWHRSPLFLLLGTLWGAGVGVASTLLYLRKLRGT